jgi:hypothetical protein
MDVWCSPLTCDITKQKVDIQLELCELQTDIRFINDTKKYFEFWRELPIQKYPNLVDSMLKLNSMFGSTHICECAFSCMKSIKNSSRTRLSDLNLHNAMRVSTSDQIVDFQLLVQSFLIDSSNF